LRFPALWEVAFLEMPRQNKPATEAMGFKQFSPPADIPITHPVPKRMLPSGGIAIAWLSAAQNMARRTRNDLREGYLALAWWPRDFAGLVLLRNL
jgi:hypothetical protein